MEDKHFNELKGDLIILANKYDKDNIWVEKMVETIKLDVNSHNSLDLKYLTISAGKKAIIKININPLGQYIGNIKICSCLGVEHTGKLVVKSI